MGKFIEQFGIKTVGEWEILDSGKYRIILTEIVPTEGKKFQSEEKEPKLMWKFETVQETNSQGFPFRINHFTRTVYTTHEKNGLNKLIKGLFGRSLSIDEFNKLDVDSLIGKKVDVLVKAVEAASGKVFTNIIDFIYIKPSVYVKPQATFAPPPVAQEQKQFKEMSQDEKMTTALKDTVAVAAQQDDITSDEIDFSDVPF